MREKTPLVRMLLYSLLSGSVYIFHVPLYAQTLLFIDTAHHQKYPYAPFFQALKTHNITSHYVGLPGCIDQEITPQSIQHYDAVVLNLSRSIVMSTRESQLFAHIKTLLKAANTQPNKTIVVLLPSEPIHKQNLSKRLHSILTALTFPAHIGMNMVKHPAIATLPAMTDVLLEMPLEKRPQQYHTTLKLPATRAYTPLSSATTEPIHPLTFLPALPQDDTLKTMSPYGIYSFNPQNKTHLIIAYGVLCTASGIEGSCQIYPALEAQQKRFMATLNTLAATIKTLTTQAAHTGLDTKKLSKYMLTKTKYEPAEPVHTLIPKQLTGWLSIDLFEQTGYRREEQQQRQLVSYIFDANIDTLWIPLNPQRFYGAFAHTRGKKNWRRALSTFTALLKEEAQRRNVSTPYLVVGIELLQYYPTAQNPLVDIHGTIHKDIPWPLHKSFWQQQVIIPLVSFFLRDWPACNNGLPLHGIMFDFELYGRKQTRTFEADMIFNKSHAQCFLKNAALPLEHATSPETFYATLKEHKTARTFWNFSQAKAKKIGLWIREKICTLIPGVTFYCYEPSISTNWFFNGFYAGLSSSQAPLNMYTFLPAAHQFIHWLNGQGISINHHSVVMLSKCQQTRDYKWVTRAQHYNHGAWLNRLNRFVEQQPDDRSALAEWSPMNAQEKTTFCQSLAQKNK